MKNKKIIYTCFLFLLTSVLCITDAKNKITSINAADHPSVRIWQGTYPKEHASFSDLVHFNGYFYCVFREGPRHIYDSRYGGGGRIRVIRSSDGTTNWQTVKYYDPTPISGYEIDLRDPKISVTGDNKIMVLVDFEYYKDTKRQNFRPYVSFSDNNGENFSELATVNTFYPNETTLSSESFWIWRFTWHKGDAYGFDYLRNPDMNLFKTTNGKRFNTIHIERMPIAKPTETAIAFDKNDKMYALVRNDAGDKNGYLATSSPPYTSWQYTKLNYQVEGQQFLFLDDQTLCIATRKYVTSTTKRTAVYVTDLNGTIKKEIILTSDDDTSYPGMVVHNNELWISYYSNHEYPTYPRYTSIYISKIPLSDLVDTPSSNPQYEQDKLLVFSPNPVKNRIYFHNALENVVIHSSAGQVIVEEKNISSLDISDLPTGVYILRVEKDKRTYIEKLIKE